MATLSNDSARIPSKNGGMTRFESLYHTILFYGTIKLEFLNYEALYSFLRYSGCVEDILFAVLVLFFYLSCVKFIFILC